MTEVMAPMDGKILQVTAKAGDQVEEDETIAVMEAMNWPRSSCALETPRHELHEKKLSAVVRAPSKNDVARNASVPSFDALSRPCQGHLAGVDRPDLPVPRPPLPTYARVRQEHADGGVEPG